MSALTTVLLALALFVSAGLAWNHFFGGFAPAPFGSRSCQGTAWKRAFPAASKEQIRGFLSTFTDSFAFRASERLQFAPDDRIMSVYRAMYPDSGGMDALELETLAMLTERRYGVRLAELWSDRLTFGELFAACAGSNSRGSDA
ncbi:hypothetical protein WG902_16760 [Ramlibacter sp. PS3R-8]|uniref:hypothetical protein n=1 Tax=Ramlibacter sp. PS3R-8 TaxID=3133437 RepID=UPI0030A989C6